MKNLSNITQDEAREFLDSFDIIVSDCDGVIWSLIPFPGVKEAIRELYRIKKQVNFLSNSALKDLATYDKAFLNIGVERTDDNFIHPSDTSKDYMVKSGYVGKKVFTIATSHTNNAFQAAGIHVVKAPNNYENDFVQLLNDGKDDPSVEAVYLDVDIQMNYLKIIKAISVLHRPEVPLIVGATDKRLRIKNFIYPGPGYFLDMFTQTTGKCPMILGKPGKYLRDVVIERFKITSPKRVLFIGDLLEQDILFGHLCNFQTLLVLSGSTSEEELKATTNQLLVPDYYLNCFADLTQVIQKANL